jgi:V/A-type H+-transporting ATPase subunit B
METYKTITKIKDPLITVTGVENAMNGDMCIINSGGTEMLGEIITAYGQDAVVEAFRPLRGLSRSKLQVTCTGEIFSIGVTEHILGRAFDGLGRVTDGGKLVPEKKTIVYGSPINPYVRDKPKDFIETGISGIDCLNSLVMGQKLPIFSGSGLPGSDIAIEIVKNAKTRKDTKFAVLFGAMGVKDSEANKFTDLLDGKNGDRTAVFINRASDSIIERITLPKIIMTHAEYLAFERGYDVLVVLTDMLSYADALRQLSSERKQVPGRRGYSSSLYTDLATIYERCGKIKDLKGSITLIPIVTMPSDDITHPVPDLTGYITEGQILLSRDLFNRKIFPPIDVLGSLSRLMDNGIGKNFTREDHRQVANQLYFAFSKGMDARNLSALIGENGLSDDDKIYLKFLDDFENKFIRQQPGEPRSIEETLDLAWTIMKDLQSLPRIEKNIIEKYGKK